MASLEVMVLSVCVCVSASTRVSDFGAESVLLPPLTRLTSKRRHFNALKCESHNLQTQTYMCLCLHMYVTVLNL